MNSSQNLNLRVVEPPHSVLALIRKLFSKKTNRQLFERSWAACVFVCVCVCTCTLAVESIAVIVFGKQRKYSKVMPARVRLNLFAHAVRHVTSK